MEEVWSWVHNERKCVTSFQVAMTLGVSRTVASFLLRDLPLHKEMPHDDDVMYEVTKTTWVEMEGKDGTKQTVIKLVKHLTKNISEDSIVYSVALKDTQNLLTAHEVQKVTLPIGLDSFALSTSLNTSRIAPSVDIDRLSLGDEGRFASMPDMAPATNKFSAKPRKTTTAATFFGQNDKIKGDKKPAPPIVVSNGKKSKSAETKAESPERKTQLMKPETSFFGNNAAVTKPRPLPEGDEEKENAPSKKGTADDFIGDDDEDDEFLAQEQERQRRNRLQKQEKDKKEFRRAEREQVAAKEKAAVAKLQLDQEQVPIKSKKRRKRLVETTTMDANGYLHTETQAIWEDVSESEEIVVKQAPVTKVTAKNGMKQGSLMGFFGKKK